MDLSIKGAVVTLLPGTTVGVRHAEGRRITHVSGAIWVTRSGDPRDVILENGSDLELRGGGRILLQALGGPALVAFEDGVELDRPVDGVFSHAQVDAAARRLRAETVAALLGGAAAGAKRLWRALGKRLVAERTRGELRALNDHMLKDIGLRRGEIDCLVR